MLEHYPEKEIPIRGDFQGLTRQCQGGPDLALVTVLLRAGVWTRDIQKSLLANMSITAAMLFLHPELRNNFADKHDHCTAEPTADVGCDLPHHHLPKGCLQVFHLFSWIISLLLNK